MPRQILFIQGGGGREDYAADAALVNSLETYLGGTYRIHYPFLPTESTPDFGRLEQIAREMESLPDPIVLVGHSLGASMLLKYLSEYPVKKEIKGVFLLATPLWKGPEAWKSGFKLKPDFPHGLPEGLPLFLYHSRDDEVVPFTHFDSYRTMLPGAVFREIPAGGHQLNNDLMAVAEDIKRLGPW